MKKHLLLFLLTLFTLAIPAAATDGQYLILTNTSNPTYNSSNKTITQSLDDGSGEIKITWTGTAAASASEIRVAKSSTITISVSGSHKIEWIEFESSGAGYSVTTDNNVTVGSISNNNKWVGPAESVTITANTGTQLRFKSITIQLESDENPEPDPEPVAPATITFDPAGGDIEETTPISITVDNEATPECTIEYSIDGGEFKTYTESFTLSAGEHTVAAKAWNTANSDNPLTAEATYTVAEPVKINGYTIVFKSGTGTADGAALSTSTATATYIESGAEYVSHISEVSTCNLAKKGFGIKVGKSGGAGKIILALSDAGKIKASKIVVSAARYNASKAVNLTVNDMTAQALASASFEDYTYTFSTPTEIETISFSTNNYSYIAAVTVYAAEEGETPELIDPQIYWTDYQFEDGAPRAITSYEANKDENESAYVIPYSAANFGQITDYTYTSTNPDVVTADNNGLYFHGIGSATVTASFAGDNTYKAAEASIDVTVTGTVEAVKPEITFEPASGTYAYNTPVTITVLNAESDEAIEITKVIADSDKLDITASGDGKFTFNLTADVDLSVYAYSADFEEATVEASYTVKRPEAPVFNPAGGEVKKGITVTVSSADGNAYYFEYTIATESGEGDVEDMTDEVTSFDFTVSEYTYVVAKAVLPNGYEGPEAEAEFTVAMPKAPGAPVFSVTEGAVAEGTTTEITAEDATTIYVARYAIDGEIGEYTEYTEPLIIDKMNCRFAAYAENEAGTTDPVEIFYSIKSNSAGAEYVLVTSADELYDGMEFIIGTYNNNAKTSFYTLSSESNTQSRIWYTKPATCEDGVITEPGENVMPMILKLAGEGKWYLMTRDEINFGANGSKEKNKNCVGYFTSGGDNNYLYMNDEASAAAEAEINFDGSDVKITLGGLTKRWICNNAAAGGISCYTNTSYPLIQLYAKQSGSGESSGYAMSIHYTPVVLDGGQGSSGDDNPIARISSSADHSYSADMDAVENEDGSTTYTASVQNLQGQFVLNVEGVDLVGHADQAVTDFHDGQDCNGVHDPYVYVGGGNDLKLVTSDHEKAVPLSTNPNEYHGMTEHHANSTISVTFKPFVGATMSVTAPDGTVTSVSNISVDTANGTDTYYNLQGVRMNAGRLAPGVYIRVNGRTATKVAVK